MPDTASKTSTEAEIRALISEVIGELAPQPDRASDGDARLVEDLDFHSLALLELAFTLEDEFDLSPITEEEARSITTVNGVATHVIAELTSRGEVA